MNTILRTENPYSWTGSQYAPLWGLDESVAFLNHGSFGATPRAILRVQQEIRDRLEAEPVRFFVSEYPELLDRSRKALAGFVGAKLENLVFVPNVTYAINSVLRSYPFREGDEIVSTNLEYNATQNVARYVAQSQGLRLTVADVPFPFQNEGEVIDAILSAISPRTRLVMLDHITSATGFRIPIESILAELNRREIDSLIDGSHSVGMVPLELEQLGATYYTSNAHKWLCMPKGSAFLHASEKGQPSLLPAAISHGFNMRQPGTPRLHDLFDWTGTDDPSPWLCVEETLRYFDTILEGGFAAYARYNHDLVVRARRELCEQWEIASPCPESSLTSLATLPLPDEKEHTVLWSRLAAAPQHPLQLTLRDRFGFEVPILPGPEFPRLWIRISACLYNDLSQYKALARLIPTLLD